MVTSWKIDAVARSGVPRRSPARSRSLVVCSCRADGRARACETGCELQILFDRVIADRYVNQCSTLKSRDELVVFDRIDGDATIAQAQHAVIFRAVSGGGVPVWMQDPFKRRRVINVTVVGGNAWSTATIMFR